MKTYREAMREAEYAYLTALLKEVGSVKRAAPIAGMSTTQFYRRMEENHIPTPHRVAHWLKNPRQPSDKAVPRVPMTIQTFFGDYRV